MYIIYIYMNIFLLNGLLNCLVLPRLWPCLVPPSYGQSCALPHRQNRHTSQPPAFHP